MNTRNVTAYCQTCQRLTSQTETSQERGGQVWTDRRCDECGQVTGRRRQPVPETK